MTMVELLVVILIAAVILTLGIGSLLGLRNRLILKQAAGEFIQNINSVRNDARNGVLPDKVTNYSSQGASSISDKENIRIAEELDYYVLALKGDTYFRGSCDQTGTKTLECAFDTQPLKSSLYEVAEMKAVNEENANTDCAAIVMSLTTGKFQFGSLSGDTVTLNNVPECNYTFTHKLTPVITAQVNVNKKTGEVKQQ